MQLILQFIPDNKALVKSSYYTMFRDNWGKIHFDSDKGNQKFEIKNLSLLSQKKVIWVRVRIILYKKEEVIPELSEVLSESNST